MYTDTLDAVETRLLMHSSADIVESVIRSRKAVRVFRPDAVSRQDIEEILDLGSTAPSNSNTQPWHEHVLSGDARRKLSEALAHAHADDTYPPFQYMPDSLPDCCRSRQEDFGARCYDALGIDKANVAARAAATGRNFDFFGAPVGIVFTIGARLKKYSWLDYGLFLRSIMIAARERGLDTCPQVSFARYRTIIAAELDIEPGHEIACGMSIGYAQKNSVVIKLAMPRALVDQFAKFSGFNE